MNYAPSFRSVVKLVYRYHPTIEAARRYVKRHGGHVQVNEYLSGWQNFDPDYHRKTTKRKPSWISG